jgi:hypothetical protein
LIKATLGTTWGQQQPWVQTGYEKHREYKTEEERGCATWQHQSGPSQQTTTTCHNPIGPPHHCGPHPDTSHLTSGPHICHVALTHWSMSAATSPGRDTWPDLIGPHYRPHQHYCHLAVCEWCTAVRRGAKW